MLLDVPTLFSREKYEDERGYFSEIWSNQHPWAKIQSSPVQENISCSQALTFRGMHWQVPPYEQGKLVSVLKGKITDYVVDLRLSSPGFGSAHSFELHSDKPQLLWVPPGFAHGFEAHMDDTLVSYQVTNMWSPVHERRFSPLSLDGIERGGEDWIMSPKDAKAKMFQDLERRDLFD